MSDFDYPRCPKCGGETWERMGGCLECEDCHHRFTEAGLQRDEARRVARTLYHEEGVSYEMYCEIENGSLQWLKEAAPRWHPEGEK